MYMARVLLCILVCTVSIMFSFCVVVREKFPSVYSLTVYLSSFNHVACGFGRSVCCNKLPFIILRPSHCPIFDCLQYDQKLDSGKVWEQGELFTQTTLLRWCEKFSLGMRLGLCD